MLNYKLHHHRKQLLTAVYLLMTGILLWAYIDTFVRQKGHPVLFILTVLMCICFGLYFYHKTAKIMEDQYV